MGKISIVICTYNRSQKVVEMVNQLLNCDLPAFEIIVVDSSDEIDFKLQKDFRIVYVRSSHKNQPYQRYLGYFAAKADWILYLDDDMEPIEQWEQQIDNLLKKYSYAGMIGLHFKEKHAQSFLKNQQLSIIPKPNQNGLLNKLRYLTGYPILAQGKFWKNGVKGRLPTVEGRTQHVCGGAFLASKKFLYQNFNMELFSLYEKRMGKGEDGILSYTVSQVAPVIYSPELLFWHNDQGNSVYTKNQYQFNKLVAFSRVYLNMEYYRLNNIPLFWAKLSYINYSLWRILGLLVNLIFSPSKYRWSSLKGYMAGIWEGFLYSYNIDLDDDEWTNRAIKDLGIIKQN